MKTGAPRRDLTTNGMKNHIKKVHPQILNDLEAAEVAGYAAAVAQARRREYHDETAIGAPPKAITSSEHPFAGARNVARIACRISSVTNMHKL